MGIQGEPYIDYAPTGEDIEYSNAAEESDFFDEDNEYQNYNFRFGQYPEDFFDFIIIDECHRGAANDESRWRAILDYFSPAVQLGLTATPKRDVNTNTYQYFGNPVFVYSLKEGIDDGFLTPFKVKRIQTTLDDYIYTNDDKVIQGHVEQGKVYKKEDFNRKIEIIEREGKNVQIYLDDANQNDKAIVFGATQAHAGLIRDLINQKSKSADPFYCVRVTANDGAIGEQFLRDFQDNEKLIPTILTTSRKLSTGVDARNIRNIVLLRTVSSMVEFKQIIGRGTRLFDGKESFTIYDYVDAYHHFLDPEWDGDPIEETPCEICGEIPCICAKTPEICNICGKYPCMCVIVDPPPPPPSGPCEVCGEDPCICKKMVKIQLAPGKELEIQHMMSTSFWGPDGKPISAQEFLKNMFGELPKLFKDEHELRTLWSNPATRKVLLDKLDDAGFGRDQLNSLQKLINAEQSDLFDVLEYVFNSDIKPISRAERVIRAGSAMFDSLDEKQREFIEFVLSKYVEVGVDELGEEKLPVLLKNRYDSLEDAKGILGDVADIRTLFINFQQYLYRSA
jgi:type I restriction enzyme, R subunit